VDATKNNGELGKIEGFIGSDKQWSQRFGYDHIGRLNESREYKSGDNSKLTYKQRFDFDRFGNMYRKAANNGTSGQLSPLPYTPIEDVIAQTPSMIDKGSNRITHNTSYDEDGNVTTDNKFRHLDLKYDANGRTVKVLSTIPLESSGNALSVYDASGLRVAESINDVWRFLVYDIGGKLVAEYGGAPAMDAGGVKYLFQDWQGSTRAVLNNTGMIKGRSDYSAFGENIAAGIGLRAAAQGFGSALVPRQKFGLTERDQGTGLDHTWFRKHENRAGRWTSPDPYGGSMSIGNPQSFNRFSYVSNDPLNFVDPTGLEQMTYCEPDVWDPRTATIYAGHCYTIGFGSGWLPMISDPRRTGEGGSFPGRIVVPTTPDSSQQTDYNDCLRKELKGLLKRTAVSAIQMYTGASLMAASSAGAVLLYRMGIRHLGAQIAAGNLLNAASTPEHAGKIAATAIPFYYGGANLFARGLETTRLNPSATAMAIKHCKELFPNSR
jgi:RHS repeat-associated protein